MTETSATIVLVEFTSNFVKYHVTTSRASLPSSQATPDFSLHAYAAGGNAAPTCPWGSNHIACYDSLRISVRPGSSIHVDEGAWQGELVNLQCRK